VRLVRAELSFDAWPLGDDGLIEAGVEFELLLGGVEDGTVLDGTMKEWRREWER